MFGRKKRKPLKQLITHKEPKSRITEQYRNIRTNIEFTSVDNHIRSIIVTSADPGDGKTTTIANLAVVFGQQGKKVLVIGADLRKPTIQNLFAVHQFKWINKLIIRTSKINAMHSKNRYRECILNGSQVQFRQTQQNY